LDDRQNDTAAAAAAVAHLDQADRARHVKMHSKRPSEIQMLLLSLSLQCHKTTWISAIYLLK
jgi:hypothetical protein